MTIPSQMHAMFPVAPNHPQQSRVSGPGIAIMVACQALTLFICKKKTSPAQFEEVMLGLADLLSCPDQSGPALAPCPPEAGRLPGFPGPFPPPLWIRELYSVWHDAIRGRSLCQRLPPMRRAIRLGTVPGREKLPQRALEPLTVSHDNT